MSALTAVTTAFPKTDELLALIFARDINQAKALADLTTVLSPRQRADLEAYIEFCLGEGLSLEYQAQSYQVINDDMVREQAFFMRKKRYRHDTYAAVADAVYHDPTYMQHYMVGLALSTFFWASHRAIHGFFMEQLMLEKEQRGSGGDYLELGPGHGLFIMEAMRAGEFDRYVGVDISATSADLTRRVLGSGKFGAFDGFDIKNQDFLAFEPDRKFDMVVMGEILEHVEAPQLFLDKVTDLLAPGGIVYLTTAINAPAVDHIYLYRTYEEVVEQIEAAGLKVRAELLVGYAGMSYEDSMAKSLPVLPAVVCERA